MPTAKTRKSLSLTEQDLADLDRIRRAPEARRNLGIQDDASEATLLHAALRRGLEAALEAAETVGYQLLAKSYQTDAEERSVATARRARRRAHTDAD